MGDSWSIHTHINKSISCGYSWSAQCIKHHRFLEKATKWHNMQWITSDFGHVVYIKNLQNHQTTLYIQKPFEKKNVSSDNVTEITREQTGLEHRAACSVSCLSLELIWTHNIITQTQPRSSWPIQKNMGTSYYGMNRIKEWKFANIRFIRANNNKLCRSNGSQLF